MRRCEPARCRSLIARRAFSTASRPSLHVLLYSYVNDVLTLRQPYRALHLEKAQQSAARGELLLGGALSDPVDGALLVFAGGHNVAERFADCDPYVQHGIVQSWTVREWSAVAGAILPPQPLLFSPSYDWQPVEPNAQMLPAGLEVELPLDGQPGRARIPGRWRLQVWVEARECFYRRDDVARDTTVGTLRADIANFLGCDAVEVSLYLERRRLDDDRQTAEELDLFTNSPSLDIRLSENTRSKCKTNNEGANEGQS